MRTYLMNIPETLRGRSNELDVKAALCRTSWVVFNEDNVRILFIFENDGSLIVSKNGVVSRQRWSYIRANSTVLIEDVQQQAFLFHPAFIDNVIFALQQDGTQHYLFMIDEKRHSQFPLLTLQSLSQYFAIKEEVIKENTIQVKIDTPPIIAKVETEEEKRLRAEKEIQEAAKRKKVEEKVKNELRTKRDAVDTLETVLIVGSIIIGVAVWVYITFFIITPDIAEGLIPNHPSISEFILYGGAMLLGYFSCHIVGALLDKTIISKRYREIRIEEQRLMEKYLKEQE